MSINQENKTRVFFENTTRGGEKKKIKTLVEQLRLRKHCITRHSRSYSELAQKDTRALLLPVVSQRLTHTAWSISSGHVENGMLILALLLVALWPWAAADRHLGVPAGVMPWARCWVCRVKPQNQSLSPPKLTDTVQWWMHTSPGIRICVICNPRADKIIGESKGWSGQPAWGM